MAMTIPGLTETQIHEIVTKVAKNHAAKTFDIHDSDDIESEVWVIVMNQISYFDHSKANESNIAQALENFLNSIVPRRLANFYRDKYVVKFRVRKKDTEFDVAFRRNLAHPISVDAIEKEPSYSCDLHDAFQEYVKELAKHLDEEMLEVFGRVLAGEEIPNYYRVKLKTILAPHVADLLFKDHGYDGSV